VAKIGGDHVASAALSFQFRRQSAEKSSVSPCHTSRGLPDRAGSDLKLAPFVQIDRRIEDHLVALFNTGAHFDVRAEIPHNG
jgi:hypothetical protein